MSLRNEKLRKIERRLRCLESALHFRVERYRIEPKLHFLKSFPKMRGRKFWLVCWIDDQRITVQVSGTRSPQYYAASWFKI